MDRNVRNSDFFRIERPISKQVVVVVHSLRKSRCSSSWLGSKYPIVNCPVIENGATECQIYNLEKKPTSPEETLITLQSAIPLTALHVTIHDWPVGSDLERLKSLFWGIRGGLRSVTLYNLSSEVIHLTCEEGVFVTSRSFLPPV